MNKCTKCGSAKIAAYIEKGTGREKHYCQSCGYEEYTHVDPDSGGE